MASIIYVGMDVHTTNFTFCCYTADSDRGFAVAQTEPDYRQVIKYTHQMRCGLRYSGTFNDASGKGETDQDGSPRRRKHCQMLGV